MIGDGGGSGGVRAAMAVSKYDYNVDIWPSSPSLPDAAGIDAGG